MTNQAEEGKFCPICQADNRCGNLSGSKEPCWCSKEFFPSDIFNLVPADQLRKACICKDCLEKFKAKMG